MGTAVTDAVLAPSAGRQATASSDRGSSRQNSTIVMMTRSIHEIAASADRHVRAFDLDTGEELWADEMPTTGNAVPMTYVSGGRQYVVIAAGGHFTSPAPSSDHLIAFALPSGMR